MNSMWSYGHVSVKNLRSRQAVKVVHDVQLSVSLMLLPHSKSSEIHWRTNARQPRIDLI